MMRKAVRWLVVAGVALTVTRASAQKLDQWRHSPVAHPEPLSGKADEDRKKKKQQQQQKEDEKKRAPDKPQTDKAKPEAPKPDSSAPSGPGAPAADTPLSFPPGLFAAGLPFGLPSAAPPSGQAPIDPAGAPTSANAAPASAPTANAGPTSTPTAIAASTAPAAAGGSAPAVAGGGSAAGSAQGPAAAGGMAAGGAATIGGGAPVGAAAAGGAGAGGGVAGGAVVAAAATSQVIAGLQLTTAGAVILGPGDAIALAPHLTELLTATSARADLLGDADVRDLSKAGERLLQAGNTDMACQVFDEAFAVRRTTANLMSLSRCNDKAGRTASAWLGYSAVTTLQGDAAVRVEASAASARLSAVLAKITLTIEGLPNGAPPAVLFDGRPVFADYWGRALPLDPGEHVVTVRAEGQPEWRRVVQVVKENNDYQVHWPDAHEEAPIAAATEAPPRPEHGSTAAIYTGSFTLLAGACGGFAAGAALSTRADFDAKNGQPGYSAQDLTQRRDTSRTWGTISTACLAAAAIGLGVTTGLIVTAHDGERPLPAPPPPPMTIGAWGDGTGAGLVATGRL